MIDNLTKSQQAVHRAGKATRHLLTISVVLLAVLGGIFAYLIFRQNILRDSVREDALWAIYQLDRETRTLTHIVGQVLSTGAVSEQDGTTLTERYDILYSRLSLLTTQKYATLFDNNPKFETNRAMARDLILELRPSFDSLALSGTMEIGTLKRAVEVLASLQRTTETILTSTNNANSIARADSRTNVMRLQALSGAVVVLLSAIIGFLIYTLLRQLRIVQAASDELAATATELSTAYNAAEAGNLAKSEFMATMGHEIRTPLNAILGMAELLSLSNLGPDEQEFVAVINSSGSTLLETINEILDFSKLEHGKMTTERVVFDARKLAEHAAHVMEGRAREQNTRIDVGGVLFPPNVGHVSDPTLVRRVLLNLVSNAVKFTNDGIVRIATSDDPEKAMLRFEVSDTGIGIPPEARERLFSPFTQVDGSIARRFGGTGLGLAICKRIVESLGGSIGVDSIVGIGSKFYFEVPAPRSALLAETSLAEPEPSGELPRLRVLLVEDNKVNRQVVGRFLENLGQHVVLAVDGEQGVSLATSTAFDIILMDMQMPGMDGIAATRQIRAAGITSPIVALTANASDRDRELCNAAGMNGFESKPVTMKRLSALIRTYGVGLAGIGREEPSLERVPSAPAGGGRRNELLAVIGEEELHFLLETFFDEVPVMLGELREGLMTNDRVRVDRTLHNLKGAAATLGFEQLATIAQSFRDTAPDHSVLDRLSEEIGAIQSRTATAAG